MYRLTKPAFADLLNQISSHFKPTRSDGIPPVLKLATTLRFLAEGGYQHGVGQDFLVAIAQTTVSVVISETVTILEQQKCADEIRFPLTEREKHETKSFFYEKYGIPGVIGCIDGTHIAIIRPAKDEHHFFNRKGFHSINAMIVSLYRTAKI